MTHRQLHSLLFILLPGVLPVCLLFFLPKVSTGQVIINSGADFAVKEDAQIIIRSSLRNNGYLLNESKIIVEGDFTNEDTTEGLGLDTFDISGDWINSKAFVAGQSTVVLSGSDQDIRGTASTTFYNLRLSGTGIKSLDIVDAVVTNHLALGDLEFATRGKKLSITATNDSAISRTTGFVSSESGGFLERYMNNDTLNYLFPLGSSAGTFRYRPLSFTPADSGIVAVSARLTNSDAADDGYDRSNRSDEVCEINPLFYHHIQRSLDQIPVSITMFYDAGMDGSWPQIAHWQNTPKWELSALASQGSDSTFSTVTIGNYENFDYTPFALMKAIPILDSSQTVITHASCNSGNDGSICVSDTPLTGTPPIQYLWSNGDTTPCITGLAAGDYTLTLVDSSGCANIYSFTINQPNNMTISGTVQDVSCKGGFDGNICLTMTGDFPPFSYSWLTGPGDSCLDGLETGFYSVTVTDSTGCTIVLPNILVDEPNLLIAFAQSIDVTCFGFDDGKGIASAEGGTEPYAYQWPTTSADTATELAPGDYEVTVIDAKGCLDSAEIFISQPDPLIVEAGPADTVTIHEGRTASIGVVNVNGGVGSRTYQWTPDFGVDNPDSSNTIVRPELTTSYTIAVTDENNCVSTDSVLVQVGKNVFPDAFIPNSNSEANRLFKPIPSETTLQLLELKVFNRWGRQMFSLEDNPNGWDGKYEGKLQPMDTYVFQAVMQFLDGDRVTESGDFILIR
jgi:gliding motility-associated-like protein